MAKMTFDKLHEDITCPCITNAKENFNSTFALKTNKNTLKEVDFKSKWEKGERAIDNDCRAICSKKGKSISLITEDNLNEVKSIFQALFPIAPGYKPHLTLVKFSNDTGLVKSTPSDANPHHYDFYKCDNFTFNNVTHLQSIPLAD